MEETKNTSTIIERHPEIEDFSKDLLAKTWNEFPGEEHKLLTGLKWYAEDNACSPMFMGLMTTIQNLTLSDVGQICCGNIPIEQVFDINKMFNYIKLLDANGDLFGINEEYKDIVAKIMIYANETIENRLGPGSVRQEIFYKLGYVVAPSMRFLIHNYDTPDTLLFGMFLSFFASGFTLIHDLGTIANVPIAPTSFMDLASVGQSAFHSVTQSVPNSFPNVDPESIKNGFNEFTRNYTQYSLPDPSDPTESNFTGGFKESSKIDISGNYDVNTLLKESKRQFKVARSFMKDHPVISSIAGVSTFGFLYKLCWGNKAAGGTSTTINFQAPSTAMVPYVEKKEVVTLSQVFIEAVKRFLENVGKK